MALSRLSSAATAARAWVSSTRQQVVLHKRALAECRELRSRLAAERAECERLRADNRRLASMVVELEQEQTALKREVERLESQVKLDSREVEGLARVNARLMSNLDKLIAHDVAAATKATNGSTQRSGIEELI